jgi:hypothetical protein
MTKPGRKARIFFALNAKYHEQRTGLEGALPVVMMRAAELQWVLTVSVRTHDAPQVPYLPHSWRIFQQIGQRRRTEMTKAKTKTAATKKPVAKAKTKSAPKTTSKPVATAKAKPAAAAVKVQAKDCFREACCCQSRHCQACRCRCKARSAQGCCREARTGSPQGARSESCRCSRCSTQRMSAPAGLRWPSRHVGTGHQHARRKEAGVQGR